jgi:hypothetical protein
MIRKYLKHYEVPNLGRVVLLATPNQGTELAGRLQRSITPIRKIFGSAVESLGTAHDELPRSLGTPDFEPGVIMGTRSAFPFLSPLVPGTDDGVVAVESGKIDGMRDFLVTPTTHCTITREKEVLRQIAFFLVHNRFDELPEAWQEAQPRSETSKANPAARATRRIRFRFGRRVL